MVKHGFSQSQNAGSNPATRSKELMGLFMVKSLDPHPTNEGSIPSSSTIRIYKFNGAELV